MVAGDKEWYNKNMEREISKNVEKPKSVEKEPKVFYHILYGSHRTAEDFAKLEKAFNKADVYIPEMARWDKDLLEEYNQVSRGKISPEWMVKKYGKSDNSFFAEELNVISDSQKPIIFADLPKEHELVKDYKEKDILESFEGAIFSFKDGKFQSALQFMRKHFELRSDYLKKRDRVIQQNLQNKIKELVESSSELKDKKDIKVLVKLGSYHTPVYHGLRRKGLSVSREFANMPEIYTLATEASRRQGLTKNKELSDEFVAKALMEKFIEQYIWRATKNSSKATRVLRKILSKLDLDNIEEISKEIGENPKEKFVKILEKRGIKLPETEEEVDNFLTLNPNS